jgi:hypothetical protein
MEGNRLLVFEHERQLRLVVGHGSVGFDLEDAERVDFWAVAEGGRGCGVGRSGVARARRRSRRPAQVAQDHIEEVGDEARVGVEFHVRGQHKVGARLLARHVATHVHRVEQLVRALVGRLAQRGRCLQRPRAVGSRQVRLALQTRSWHLTQRIFISAHHTISFQKL